MAVVKHKVTGVVVEVSDEAAQKLTAIDYESVAEPRVSKTQPEK